MRSKLPTRKQEAGKKAYEKPALIRFGRVSELTLSNGSSGYESNCGNAINDAGIRRCSERRTKENLERIGTHPLGFGIYTFEYREPYRDTWGHGRQTGVMVDEVEPVCSEAISMHPDGYRLVDYAVLELEHLIH